MTRLRVATATLLLLGVLALGDNRGAHPSTPLVTAARVTTTSSTVAPTTTTVTTSPPATAPPWQSAVRVSRGRANRPPLARPALTPEIRARVEAAICSYEWDCGLMVKVASCESGLDPWNVSRTNPYYRGIFMIGGSTLGLIEEHVALAHSMWRKSGLRPWYPSRHCWG